MRERQSEFTPWAGGDGPNAWKMNRFIRSTEARVVIYKMDEPMLQEMAAGIETDLPKNPADLGKGNDLGNKNLW